MDFQTLGNNFVDVQAPVKGEGGSPECHTECFDIVRSCYAPELWLVP